MAKMFDLLGGNRREDTDAPAVGMEDDSHVHTEFQEEEIERNLKASESTGVDAEKLQTRMEKGVQTTLRDLGTDSARRIRMISHGYCPDCGSKLQQHLYTNICLACGWTSYTMPPRGPVTVYLKDGQEMTGDFCYRLRHGDLILIRNEVVQQRIAADAYARIDYGWTEEAIAEKERQRLHEEKLTCSWCEQPASPNNDEGFSIVYAAFGAYQNRYVFCSSTCQEAFMERYPSRVHRNCYETDCAECDLCTKRYDTTLDSFQVVKRIREQAEGEALTQDGGDAPPGT